MKRTYLIFGTLILFLLSGNLVFAFKPLGHEVVEAIAYKELLKNETGRSVLAGLIRHGLLKQPEVYEDEIVEVDHLDDLTDILPYIGSGEPDLMFSRQLSSNGQCFHFMALPDDVWDSPKTVGDEVPILLTKRAYHRCIMVLTKLVSNALETPKAIRSKYERTYAAMHIIGDAYAKAHVKRTGDGAKAEIEYLQPWKLKAFPRSYGYDYFSSERENPAHACFDEPRDEDYKIKEKCGDLADHYLWTKECLTDHGNAAVSGIKEFLITLSEISKKKKEDRDLLYSYKKDVSSDSDWSNYLDDYLDSKYESITLNSYPYGKLEWNQDLKVGFRYQHLNYEQSVVLEYLYPISFFHPLKLGFAYERGNTAFEREYYGFSPIIVEIPLSENISLGIKPYSILRTKEDRAWGTDTKSYSYSSMQFNVFLEDRFWVAIEPKRVYHISPEMEDEYTRTLNNSWAVTAGFAFDTGSLDDLASYFSSDTANFSENNWELLTNSAGWNNLDYSNFSLDQILYFGGGYPEYNRYNLIGYEFGISYDWDNRQRAIKGYAGIGVSNKSERNHEDVQALMDSWIGVLYKFHKLFAVGYNITKLEQGESHRSGRYDDIIHYSLELRAYPLNKILISLQVPHKRTGYLKTNWKEEPPDCRFWGAKLGWVF